MPNRTHSCWRGCALLLFGLLAFTGCGEPTKKIVLLINTENAFWNATRAGVKEAATDLKFGDAKYEAYVDSNVGQAKGQIEKLTSYLGPIPKPLIV